MALILFTYAATFHRDVSAASLRFLLVQIVEENANFIVTLLNKHVQS